MPKKKKTADSPRIAHVDFIVEKEKTFLKYVKYLTSPWQIIWRHFLVGTAQGVGFILGTALFLTVMGFILTKVLGSIPFFSDFSDAVNIWLENTLQSQQ